MSLNPLVVVALLVGDLSSQPSPTPETPEAAKPSSENQSDSPEETQDKKEAQPQGDASSDPSLEVPDLDNEVLDADAQKSLDSLNPAAPKEKPEKKEKKEKAAPQEPASQGDPAPEPAPDSPDAIRFSQSKPQQEALRWGDGSSAQEAMAFSDQRPEHESINFAATSTQPSIQDDPGALHNPLRRGYEGRKPSPQRFALNFKMGPYLPMIDKGDPNGPYAKVFGEVGADNRVTKAPSQELIYWLGFEWQFINLGGPLSVGLDLGFFTDSQSARLQSDLTRISPADENRFSFVPMALLLGYRFAYLAEKTPIPLVPYARAGMAYNVWWAQRTSGKLVRDAQGTKVRGGMFGFQVHAGLALRLDGIFRRAGREMDARFGINHVSLFGEFSTSKSGLNNKKINVGDNTFYGGLLLEF